MRRTAVIATLLALAFATSPTIAQDGEPHFKGKQIKILIGSTSGGGYDVFARTIAAHWGKHIPGNPSFVPQNMPGPLSINVANHIFTIAPKDGTVIGGVNPQIASEAILDPERARYDARQLLWIGSALREVQVLVARADAAVKTFKDAFDKELIVGGSGGATSTFPQIANAILGTKFKVVTGYPGTKEINLAMERGEVHGVGSVTWASIKATMGEMLVKKTIVLPGQYGVNKHRELPDVPRVLDFAKSEDDIGALMLLFATQEFGRPYIAPPGLAAPVAKTLRDSFMATMADKEFLAEASQRNLEINPTTGEEIEGLVKRLYATPAPVVERVRKVFAQVK